MSLFTRKNRNFAIKRDGKPWVVRHSTSFGTVHISFRQHGDRVTELRHLVVRKIKEPRRDPKDLVAQPLYDDRHHLQRTIEVYGMWNGIVLLRGEPRKLEVTPMIATIVAKAFGTNEGLTATVDDDHNLVLTSRKRARTSAIINRGMWSIAR